MPRYIYSLYSNIISRADTQQAIAVLIKLDVFQRGSNSLRATFISVSLNTSTFSVCNLLLSGIFMKKVNTCTPRTAVTRL
jgi:hypothetical protein